MIRDLAYWTVLAGPALAVVGDIDDPLRHLRLGRAREESTIKTCAGHLKRFRLWSDERGLSRSEAAFRLPAVQRLMVENTRLLGNEQPRSGDS
ncbi:hypothetical protein ACWDR5_14625 [Streptomyces koyangensis]|uniref:hypothetical protein n=1 Tax=Streptomyces koyangensis TaxID=188770 RepID=UPI003C3019C1